MIDRTFRTYTDREHRAMAGLSWGGQFEYRSTNYLANTDKANELIHTNLFRPPHGHMRWMQYMVLRHKYQIVMASGLFKGVRDQLSSSDATDGISEGPF